MLAVFYVPFVLNPSFRITYAYITVNRIGSTFPYNNLVDVFERTTLYSSVYYVALLVICAVPRSPPSTGATCRGYGAGSPLRCWLRAS